jgi:hypothetical protein
MLIEKDVYRVGGDNQYREFSGWQKGLETLNGLDVLCDVILFANSAFLKPGESFLRDYADITLLRKLLDDNAIVGRIDNIGKRFFVYGYDVSHWVCTNCFFVPKTAAEDIRNLVPVKDNINDFVDDHYDSKHLLIDRELTASDIRDGHFSLDAQCSYSGLVDLRIAVDRSFVPKRSGLSEDIRELSICLTELTISNQDIHSAELMNGFYDYPKDRWIAKNALLTFPVMNAGKFFLKGYVPTEILETQYGGRLRIKVFNDSLLFKENAPLSRNYQQWIIEWLTQHWHSRFEISEQTWEVFRGKVLTILNEALLSAKFAESGYLIRSYGTKKYY